MGGQFLTFMLDNIVCQEESLTNEKISISHVDHRQERKKEILEVFLGKE